MSQGASQGAGDDYPAAENWALQKVMVAKSTPLPEAERIYKKITGRAPPERARDRGVVSLSSDPADQIRPAQLPNEGG